MQTKNQAIIYKELSYKIIGIIYDVFNKLGYGYKEKFYQSAIANDFTKQKIFYDREVYAPLIYDGKNIGKQFFDFLIEKIIVLEIKKGDRISKKDIEQLYSYLKTNNLKLGIIARFTSRGVIIKRIVNLS